MKKYKTPETLETFHHTGWKAVVLENYPKVFLSPMRELLGNRVDVLEPLQKGKTK